MDGAAGRAAASETRLDVPTSWGISVATILYRPLALFPFLHKCVPGFWHSVYGEAYFECSWFTELDRQFILWFLLYFKTIHTFLSDPGFPHGSEGCLMSASCRALITSNTICSITCCLEKPTEGLIMVAYTVHNPTINNFEISKKCYQFTGGPTFYRIGLTNRCSEKPTIFPAYQSSRFLCVILL